MGINVNETCWFSTVLLMGVLFGFVFGFFHITEKTTPGVIKNQDITTNTTVPNLLLNVTSMLPSSQHKSKYGDCTVLMDQGELPSECLPAHSYRRPMLLPCFLLLPITQGQPDNLDWISKLWSVHRHNDMGSKGDHDKAESSFTKSFVFKKTAKYTTLIKLEHYVKKKQSAMI